MTVIIEDIDKEDVYGKNHGTNFRKESVAEFQMNKQSLMSDWD